MKLKKDFQNMKKLRDRLSIPLDLAKELIIENDGDLLTCEQEFHRNNINTICRLADCDEIIAKKYYKIYEFDIEKSIKKIHEQLFYLTVNPNEPIDNIGFILTAENESLDKYVTPRDKSLFIQSKDFEYVIDAFKSVFPLTDSETGEMQECFDIVSDNFFNNKTSRIIVNKMAEFKTKDPNVESFLRNLIKWLNIQLRYADNIIVYGNL